MNVNRRPSIRSLVLGFKLTLLLLAATAMTYAQVDRVVPRRHGDGSNWKSCDGCQRQGPRGRYRPERVAADEFERLLPFPGSGGRKVHGDDRQHGFQDQGRGGCGAAGPAKPTL